MDLSKIIDRFWQSSPADIMNFIRRKIGHKGKRNWNYSLKVVLQSKKHLNSQKLIDRWERYWRVIENNTNKGLKKYFQFNNKTIFELGSGPVFGWGPIALFRGATKYYYYEPSMMRHVVESELIKEKYFLPLYKELSSNFGYIMNFDEYYEKVITGCVPIDFSKKAIVDLIY